MTCGMLILHSLRYSSLFVFCFILFLISTKAELLMATGEYMEQRFKQVCVTVMKFKDNRDKLIKRTVIQMLAILASFSPQQFIMCQLAEVMTWLLSLFTREKKGKVEKSAAFLAIGQIAVVNLIC